MRKSRKDTDGRRGAKGNRTETIGRKGIRRRRREGQKKALSTARAITARTTPPPPPGTDRTRSVARRLIHQLRGRPRKLDDLPLAAVDVVVVVAAVLVRRGRGRRGREGRGGEVVDEGAEARRVADERLEGRVCGGRARVRLVLDARSRRGRKARERGTHPATRAAGPRSRRQCGGRSSRRSRGSARGTRGGPPRASPTPRRRACSRRL